MFGTLCLEQFTTSGNWVTSELVPKKDLVAGFQCEPVGCRIRHNPNAKEPTCDTVTSLRVREGIVLPEGMVLASGNVLTTVLPLKPIDPQTLKVPATVAKKLIELDKKLMESSQFVYDEDREVANALACDNDNPESCLQVYNNLLAKAKTERLHMVDQAHQEQNMEDEHPRRLHLGDVGHAGWSPMEWTGLQNGTLVIGEDGHSLEYTDQVLARHQRRDRVDKDRFNAVCSTVDCLHQVSPVHCGKVTEL